MKNGVALTLFLLLLLGITVNHVKAEQTIQYSEHLTFNNKVGYEYDITNCSIAWVKQATGALIWVPQNDLRDSEQIINQAKEVDSSLENATKNFDVLWGIGKAYTPNQNGSKAEVDVFNVYINAEGRLVLKISGAYSHFVCGEIKPEPPQQIYDELNLRVDTPLGMEVHFEDGTVYNNGEYKTVNYGQEYHFQMCTKGVEELVGAVVHTLKVVHQDTFMEMKKIAQQDPDRYIVKGMDIIDTNSHLIIVNGDAENTHLETDVNSFFMAYRFYYKSIYANNYKKETAIENLLEIPVEALSINLPLGSVVNAKFYDNNNLIKTDNILIEQSDDKGCSYKDYYWR